MDIEVLIAGAGPAGIATAVGLARQRPDWAQRGAIVCFDRARFPREKPCGGGLTGHARAALDHLGLQVRVPSIPCDEGEIVFGKASETVALKVPVEVIRRSEFDEDLVRQARALGVVVHEAEGVASYEVLAADACIRATTSTGRSFEARVLVAADGAGSRIRQQLIQSDPHAPVQPLRLFKHEISTDGPPPARMIYDLSPMTEGLRGYVWLFPVSGNRLNVGIMHYPSRKLSGAEIEGILNRALARHGVRLPSTARGWPAWPYDPRATISSERVLCVGDAAGIDALTGEGIAVGLEHGAIAAKQIVEAFASNDFALAGYAQAVAQATVGRELVLDARIAKRLYAPRGFRYWLSLVMFDRRVRELYAARVCGSLVLSDQLSTLAGAFVRHLVLGPLRVLRLARVR